MVIDGAARAFIRDDTGSAKLRIADADGRHPQAAYSHGPTFRSTRVKAEETAARAIRVIAHGYVRGRFQRPVRLSQ
jgi:hypothetical protein